MRQYIILRKLEFSEEGGSDKYLRDIKSVLDMLMPDVDLSSIEETSEEKGHTEAWKRVAPKAESLCHFEKLSLEYEPPIYKACHASGVDRKGARRCVTSCVSSCLSDLVVRAKPLYTAPRLRRGKLACLTSNSANARFPRRIHFPCSGSSSASRSSGNSSRRTSSRSTSLPAARFDAMRSSLARMKNC